MSLSVDLSLPIKLELSKFKRQYYFDLGANPMSKKVASSMKPFLSDNFANPVSLHQAGQEANLALKQARAEIIQIIKAKSSQELIFTSGVTESNNLALKGIAWQAMLNCRDKKYLKNHILLSPIEHPSVTASIKSLVDFGFTYDFIPVDRHGRLLIKALIQKITPKTLLVSVMGANNQFGTIQDLSSIGKICRAKGVIFHSDLATYFGLHSIDVEQMYLDLATLSSTKIYGPFGVSALYKRQGLSLYPLMHGGGQEFNYRSGTHNLPAIIGFVTALKEMEQKREKLIKKYQNLSTYFIKQIRSSLDHIFFNGHPAHRLANNLHLSILGVEGESLVLNLSRYGISVATGSACSSHKLEADPALKALGLPPELVHGSLRLFWHEWTKKEDLDYLIKKLVLVTRRLRKISAYKVD